MEYELDELRSKSLKELRLIANRIRSLFRDKGKLEEAIRENQQLLTVYSGMDSISDEYRLNLAILQYEQGYIFFLQGSYGDSVSLFQQSGENSRLANDPIGEQISIFRVVHTRVFEGSIDYDEAQATMLSCLSKLSVLHASQAKPDRTELWIYNIQRRLFDLAVEFEDKQEAKLRLEDVKKAQYRKDQYQTSMGDPVSLHAIYEQESRLHFLYGRYNEALVLYSQILDVDLSEWGSPDPDYIGKANQRQEIAREYLYAGRCLLALSKEDRAIEVLNAGLRVDEQLANRVFQDRIRDELASIQRNDT